MPQEALFDIGSLRQLTEGNADIESQIIVLYMETVQRCVTRLEALAVNDIHREWAPVVHELKGASLNIHAAQVASLCREIMELPPDAKARRAACQRLRQSYAELEPMLRPLVLPKK